MTFAGFLLLVFNFVAGSWYCPEVTGCTPPPNWVYLVVALNIWLYQTLDNIDGKQARRTGSSSPLGELFDHGCDSLFLLMNGMAWFPGMQATGWQSFLFLTQGTLAFFGSHWEEYHTHKLILGVVANPTEVQYAIMAAFVSMGVLGPSWWAESLSQGTPSAISNFLIHTAGVPAHWFDITRTEFALHSIWLGIAFALIFNGYEAIKASIKDGKGALAPLHTIIPYVIQEFTLVAWACWSKFDVINNHTWLFLCMHGLLFSILCVRSASISLIQSH